MARAASTPPSSPSAPRSGKRAYIPAGEAAHDPRRGLAAARHGGRGAAAARPPGRRLRRRQHGDGRRADRQAPGRRRGRRRLPPHPRPDARARVRGRGGRGGGRADALALDDQAGRRAASSWSSGWSSTRRASRSRPASSSGSRPTRSSSRSARRATSALLEGVAGIEVEDGVVAGRRRPDDRPPGVFAGGDMVPAERTVTVAIGHGKTRRPPHRRLAARERLRAAVRSASWPASSSSTPGTTRTRRAPHRAALEVARRAGTFDEVVHGLDARQRPVRGAALPVLRQLLLLRQLLRRLSRQRGAQARRAGRAQRYDRPRLLQGLRPLRRRVPLRRDRDGARGGLMPAATDTTRAWVYDLNDGSAEMRELLGNKGANLAEMTRVLGTENGARRLHHHHRRMRRVHAQRRPAAAGLEDQIAEAVGELERAERASDSAIPRIRCCSPSARGAPVSMPGMLDTDPQPRADRGLGRGSGPAHRQRPLRLGLAPPARADVLRGGPAAWTLTSFESCSQRGATRRRVSPSTATSTRRRCGLWPSASSSIYASHTGESFPEDPRTSFAWRSRPSSTPGTTSAQHLPSAQRHPRRPRHRGHRPADGLRQPGRALRRRRRLHARPDDGSPGPDGDFLLNAQGEDVVAGVRNTEDLDGLARRMPEIHAELLESLSQRSNATTATSRTSSTRSRRGASSSSRREAPSGTPSPRSALPSTPSRRAARAARRRCGGSSRTRSAR